VTRKGGATSTHPSFNSSRGRRRHGRQRRLRRRAAEFAAAAIIEAAEGGITFIVCITRASRPDEAVTYNRLVEDFPACACSSTARHHQPGKSTSASPR